MQSGERITYLVCCDDDPSPELDAYLTSLVGHLWYARMYKAQIVTTDSYTGLLVIKACDRFGLDYQCVGTRRRARNGVTPYHRIASQTEMIVVSDVCFFVGDRTRPLVSVARQFDKHVYTKRMTYV